MGQLFSEFARNLMEKKSAVKEPKKFLEFLSAPSRMLIPTKNS
jgi:hypothetical protein